MLSAIKDGMKLTPFSLLLNPSFWLAICAWTAFVGYYAHDVGVEKERLKQTEITAKALQKQVEVNDKVLAAERRLRAADAAEFIQFKEKQDHAQAITTQLLSDIRSDNLRLRIPVRSPVCRAAPAGSGQAATGIEPQGYADVDPGTSAALVAITSRGDSAILKHAEVVDRYERLRLACTAPTDSPTTTGDTP